jgi:hypothetical protein
MADSPKPEHANFLQHTGEGICFAHGPYKNADGAFGCPKWPACITAPHNPEFVAMGRKSVESLPQPAAPPETCPTCGSPNRGYLGDGCFHPAPIDPWHDVVAAPEPNLYLWSCVNCRKRIQTRENLHINSRIICAECNAEMEPYIPHVTPLSPDYKALVELAARVLLQHINDEDYEYSLTGLYVKLTEDLT